ncbi:MAG: hypothetical protein ACYSOK_04405, partial [Planctomycetota bacterium]
FVYADLGSAKINGSNLSGEYDRNDVYFLGLHANWKYKGADKRLQSSRMNLDQLELVDIWS